MNPAWSVALPAIVLAILSWMGCALIVMRSGRHRVPVVGQVVRRSRFRRPPQLDVSYRVPEHDGLFQARLTAGFALAQEGQPITVYVSPTDPRDASLGPGGSSHVWALLLGVWGLMAAAFALRVLTL